MMQSLILSSAQTIALTFATAHQTKELWFSWMRCGVNVPIVKALEIYNTEYDSTLINIYLSGDAARELSDSCRGSKLEVSSTQHRCLPNLRLYRAFLRSVDQIVFTRLPNRGDLTSIKRDL